ARLVRDWSSDVGSADLKPRLPLARMGLFAGWIRNRSAVRANKPIRASGSRGLHMNRARRALPTACARGNAMAAANRGRTANNGVDAERVVEGRRGRQGG